MHFNPSTWSCCHFLSALDNSSQTVPLTFRVDMHSYEICHHVVEKFGSTVFITSRITIPFNKACRGAIFTHWGRVWLWDVSLPSPCHSIVQLKYTTETQPWTTLKELQLHCLLHFNTSINTRFTFSCRSSVAFKTTERQRFPVFYCHPKATDAQP